MARDDSPPFPRGNTWYNGNTIDITDLGAPNLEGKEFVFEVNAPDDQVKSDPTGRYIRVRMMRNGGTTNILPGRLCRYMASSSYPYESRVDGYCTSTADRVAGVSDEFLPPQGVPPNDLFYLIVEGPSQIQQGATTAANVSIGTRLVPAAYGATAGDPLGGRFAAQDTTQTGANLFAQLQTNFGFAGAANNTAGSMVPVIVRRSRW